MEFAVYKRSGVFLCLLGISYLLVCLRMHFIGDVTVYGGYTIYLVATLAFTKMGFAIYGAIARNRVNPIVSVLKIINFTDAMASIVVTQCTLLTMRFFPCSEQQRLAWNGIQCRIRSCRNHNVLQKENISQVEDYTKKVKISN